MGQGNGRTRIQDQFLANMMTDSATEQAMKIQRQALLESLHMHAIKDVYVGLLRDYKPCVHFTIAPELSADEVVKLRDAIESSRVGSSTMILPHGVEIEPSNESEVFDKAAATAKLAGDRLMIALGVMKEPGAEGESQQ